MRVVGLDFREGEPLLAAGPASQPRATSRLIAAANRPTARVRRKPRVAILATGDELRPPGETLGPAQIVASNNFFVAGLALAEGAETIDLGIAADRPEALAERIAAARAARADVLVTLGGASVGDYDLVQKALTDAGMELGFWRIAMRPGKPLMFGRIGAMLALGLPGNPTSSAVCGLLFLRAAAARACKATPPPAPTPASRRGSPWICPPTACVRTTCARRSRPTAAAGSATPFGRSGFLAGAHARRGRGADRSRPARAGGARGRGLPHPSVDPLGA